MKQRGATLLSLVVLLGILGIIGLKTDIFSKVLVKPSPPQPLTTPQVQKVSKDESAQQTRLEKYLITEAALLGVSDNISLYFKDLDHGKEISIDSTRSWIPASTIKTYVVVEAFRQKSLGLIDFDQIVSIKAENVVPTELETDEFPRLREGAKTSIKQLVETMIIQSDNTAYNTLLDILDRRNINLSLKNIGITGTVVGEKLNLDETQLQQDLQVAGRQSNTTTVKDLATFFDLLYNKKIANADEILAIFKRQKINNMIPALLPHDTIVAHKSGDWAPIYHDGGVVFKPDDPFILTVFTNSDNPGIVAQLAKVAYFQNAESVGKLVSFNPVPPSQNHSQISLAQSQTEEEVLAAETPEKFPEISASDLGITQKDLNVNSEQAKNFLGALITPGSIFYNLKKLVEDTQLKAADGSSTRVKTYLNISKSRLAEAKSLISAGDFKNADTVLKESESNLEQATELAKKDPNRDLLLVQIKQVNDLHFAIFSERADHLKNNQKEQFVDSVYNFYEQNHQKVTPTINSSVIANPTQQKPAIGTITEVKNNQAKIQFDDGSSKQILLTADTKVRSFQESAYQGVNTVTTGDKVAVVGLSNSKSEIVPQFILKDIPKELPEKHQGTIIEIKPDENTIKILDKKGQQETIKVNLDTVIKGKDTSVSLEGIKAGSQVTVFGIITTPLSFLSPGPSVTPSLQPSVTPFPLLSSSLPSPKNLATPIPSVIPTTPSSKNSAVNTSNKNTPVPQPATTSKPASTQTTQPQPINIQAASVTVTKNSSGKQEKIESKPTEQKQEPKKDPPKNEAPKVEPKKVEPKQNTDKSSNKK